jgi:ATP synthase protein I
MTSRMDAEDHRTFTGWHRWDEEDAAANRPVEPLTREQAQALRAEEPAVSAWWVVAAQAAMGLVVAGIAWAATGRMEVMWSALYGAAAVVLPSALMARGMTSRLSSMSPGVSAMSFMTWESVKLGASIAMLALAPKLVPLLSWPALLAGLVVCIKVYWVALLWRRPRKEQRD